MTMAGNATNPLPLLPFLPLELVLRCCGPWGAVPAQVPPGAFIETCILEGGSHKFKRVN